MNMEVCRVNGAHLVNIKIKMSGIVAKNVLMGGLIKYTGKKVATNATKVNTKPQ